MDILDLVDTVHDNETDDDVEDCGGGGRGSNGSSGADELERSCRRKLKVSWDPCAPSAFCASPRGSQVEASTG